VASDDGSEMVVAEAAAPRQAEKQASHRTSEKAAKVQVEKKPKDLDSISYYSTKADCLARLWSSQRSWFVSTLIV